MAQAASLLQSRCVRVEHEGDVAVVVIDNPPINAGSFDVRSGLLAGATILVWKAWLTGMRMAWKPLAVKRSMACSTALLAPPTTHWL